MADDDIKDAIKSNAEGPAEARGDSGSMRQHSLPDQITADKYLAAKEAMKNGGLGIRLIRIVPPGAV